MAEKKRIIFVCTQNSARSQMAEGLMRAMYGNKYEVFSAGTKPFRVNPYAIKAMEQIGIDISKHRSKSIDEFIGMEFDYVVTVCDNAKEECPYIPGGKEYLHHSFPDPAKAEGSEKEILMVFAKVRDEIKEWLKANFND